tara:strand:+ start:1372 stop:4221 length:2850 start_codon:yes stop_codon:yes gene_type:complete
MKIPKVMPIKNSRVLSEQAERLLARPLTLGEGLYAGTEENPFKEAEKALRGDSVQSVSRPLSIRPGTMAHPAPLNKFFSAVKDDLEIISKTSIELGDLAVLGHNKVMIKKNDVVGELKTLRDRIATLKLYSTDITDSDQYVAYTFTDGSQIGVPESEAIAGYGEEEGVITLPVESISRPAIKKVKIVDGSNGEVGNNYDRTRIRHGAVGSIIDSEPLTWFEYEKIAGRGQTLRLILRFEFEEDSVVNRVVIDPINFGTANWVKVEDIEVQTSNLFTSIKMDVTNPSWDPNSDPFRLTPGSSKFAGKGVYTFRPRLARSLQITLSQGEPSSSPNARGLRYAIGIRDIEIQQVKFNSEGEFLLTEAKFNSPVRAIGITENLNPFNPKLASVQYSISTDSGETWVDIVGMENKDSAKLEALVLESPSDLVIIKGKLERLHDGFTGSINAEEDDGLFEESKIFPSSSISSAISLRAEPQSFLEIIEMRMGSMGDYGPKYYLGQSSGVIGAVQVFPIPIELDKRDVTLLVGDEEWARTHAFASATSKTFIYDTTGAYPVIITGDGSSEDTAIGGAVPYAGASLYLKVKPLQNPQVDKISGGYRMNLTYGASKINDSTRVVFNDLTTHSSTSVAGPGSSYIEIPWERHKLEITGLVTSAVNWFEEGTEQDFQNGEAEFELLPAGYYWSIDTQAGRVYLSPATGVQDGDIEVSYDHILRALVPEDEWKYANSLNAIDVRSPLMTPRFISKEEADVVPGRVMNLNSAFGGLERTHSIMRSSVRGKNFSGIVAGTNGMAEVLKTEIEYVNGTTEFARVRGNAGQANILGHFSVNYEENTIHLPPDDLYVDEDKGFLAGTIEWEYISSEIHYGLGVKLEEGSEYSVAGRAVETTPFFMESLEDKRRRLGRSFDFHVRYNLIGSKSIEGSVLEEFYSPVLRDLALVGIRIDPRLGTLENL